MTASLIEVNAKKFVATANGLMAKEDDAMSVVLMGLMKPEAEKHTKDYTRKMLSVLKS